MTPYYAHPGRQHVLIHEAFSWLGTPFVHRGRSKQAGVDCVGLPLLVYQVSGLFKEFPVPRYSLDGGNHLAESPLDKIVEGLGCFQLVWMKSTVTPMISDCLAGDLILMQLGRVPYHAGLSVGGSAFIHAHPISGVIMGDLRDWTYAKRVQKLYRPTL